MPSQDPNAAGKSATYQTSQSPYDYQLIRLAWAATLVISAVPDILFHLFTGTIPPWLIYAKSGLLLALSVAALIWKSLRPLSSFFIVMFAFFTFAALRPQINFTWPFLQRLFGSSVFDARMQAEQTGKLAVSLGMIGVLLLLGYKPRAFFLRVGDLNAPIKPVRLLGFPKADPWYRLALQWGLYIAAALAVMQFLLLRPSSSVWPKVLAMLPSILFYAALNAFNEEMTYRAPMLAALEPATGGRQALWISAFFFGIAHYFGTPGGILGGLLSIFMGWLLGKGMLETRGLFWSWWMHFLSDIAIFIFLAATLVK